MMISPGELQELLLYLPEGSPEILRSGRFEMMLGPAHEHSVTAPNGDEFSSGSACVDGDRIQFLDETPAGGACSGFGEGVYRWEVVADRVIFDKVSDTCIWREVLTVGQAWMKVPS